MAASVASLPMILVQDHGRGAPSLGRVEATLCFAFADNVVPTAGGLELPVIEGVLQVPESTRLFTGEYSQQLLNRSFALQAMRSSAAFVLVDGPYGCTADILRIAALLGMKPLLHAVMPLPEVDALPPPAANALRACLEAASRVFASSPEIAAQCEAWGSLDVVLAPSDAALAEALSALPAGGSESRSDASFDYALYEFCHRDHPLLTQMQRGDTAHFGGCRRALDVGCGVGIFVQCLQREGVTAVGVERNESVAGYARGMGLDVRTEDALAFLERTDERFDGVYCSHFVEHLPTDAVERLIRGIARVLEPGGIAVFAFPDPESIRSQLLGFWRDPEHVRYYHPELVEALAFTAGLELEWSSHEAQPHRIVPFSEDPAPLALPDWPAEQSQVAPVQRGPLGRLLDAFGLASRRRVELAESQVMALQAQINALQQRQARAEEQLAERTETLWAVNRTWAWNDNATLRFRRR